ncbi:MAG: extracellular solute-binding protein [Anaerolineae bacterium]
MSGMKRYLFIAGVLATALVALAACVAPTPGVPVEEKPEPVSLVYMTAGDVNMLALGQNVFAPEFNAENPNVDVRTVHTGPGEAGSRIIFEKLMAEKEAGKEAWDVDVAMVHQIFLTWAMEEDILLQYAHDAETWKYVTSPHAKNALGADVDGYVIPMFHSQTALAYNPEFVPEPPQSYEELVEWVQANPGKFGYNGIKGGMSGVAFTTGWVYWKTGNYDKYAVTGPFDEAEVATWESAFKDMKDFNQFVTFTAGNVGTLDALNRGEIWAGPVWVDMFYTFMQEGKLDPNLKLTILSPGMPGQPMYFVVPKKARNPEWARKFIEFATNPKTQGEVIIDRYNWYPGIDGKFVKDVAPPEAFDRLYADVSPEDLAKYGRAFPLAAYFEQMLEAYERWAVGD